MPWKLYDTFEPFWVNLSATLDAGIDIRQGINVGTWINIGPGKNSKN